MSELERKQLDDLSSIGVEYFTTPLPSIERGHALVIEFKGTCGFGSGSNGDCRYMSIMAKVGVDAWDPDAVILDFRKLEYRWGDMMGSVLTAAHRALFMPEVPLVVIVSDLNREGMTSFIEQEMDVSVGDWLFETLETAISAVDCRAKENKEIRMLRLADLPARWGKKPKFAFFELVRIEPPHELAGSGGVVVGESDDLKVSGVWVFSQGKVYAVPNEHLHAMGEKLTPEQWNCMNFIGAFKGSKRTQ